MRCGSSAESICLHPYVILELAMLDTWLYYFFIGFRYLYGGIFNMFP